MKLPVPTFCVPVTLIASVCPQSLRYKLRWSQLIFHVRRKFTPDDKASNFEKLYVYTHVQCTYLLLVL